MRNKSGFFSAILLSLLVIIAGKISAQSPRLSSRLMSQLVSDSTFTLGKNVQEIRLHYLNAKGKPMAVFILKARLKRKKLTMEAATPFNKDTFCRQGVTNLMQWEDDSSRHVLAGVNADFFNLKTGEPEGLEIKEGEMLKDTIRKGRGFAGLLKNGKIVMGDAALYARKKSRLKEALGGYQVLIREGQVIPQTPNTFSTTRHPRTAVGRINAHNIVFVVVDGRQPDYANGMPLDELALLMQALGARDAINLDGGGSSTLVTLNSTTGKWVIRNSPSDGKERPVANAWILVHER